MNDAYEPFHIRQRNLERQEEPVLYKYDELPDSFRVQVVRILEQVIGEGQGRGGVVSRYTDPNSEPFGPPVVWEIIANLIADRLGTGTGDSRGYLEFFDLMFRAPRTTMYEKLTGVEDAFREVTKLPGDYQSSFGRPINSREAVNLLNMRFREHDLGYAFEVDRLIRVDSQYLHSQTVEPALQLLSRRAFEGAEHEFLKAHEHFRHGENEDAIVDAARAFESTMKQICDELDWEYSERAMAKDLIRAVIDNGLFPKWQENHLNSLKTLLEGLPTLRNKSGSHGLGSEIREVPEDMAAFAIHLAASNIVFMVEAFERLRTS